MKYYIYNCPICGSHSYGFDDPESACYIADPENDIFECIECGKEYTFKDMKIASRLSEKELERLIEKERK